VVGRVTGDGNEEVIAFVELKEDAEFDLEELQDYLAARLSAYKRPAQIVRVDVIPTTASGKLLKQKLRALAGELQAH
jgi:acyl-CoA synthetase (AMP-forming)/AMP-acid ligase II